MADKVTKELERHPRGPGERHTGRAIPRAMDLQKPGAQRVERNKGVGVDPNTVRGVDGPQPECAYRRVECLRRWGTERRSEGILFGRWYNRFYFGATLVRLYTRNADIVYMNQSFRAFMIPRFICVGVFPSVVTRDQNARPE